MSRYQLSTFKSDRYSPDLRRTSEDYGDSRDTYRGVTNYNPHPNPSPGYWGYVMGVKNIKHIGIAREALVHHLLSLNHSTKSLKLRNVVDVYDFQKYVPRPRQTDVDYMNAIERNFGHSPYRLPPPVGYKGYMPRYDDVSHRKQIWWAEGLANMFRRKEIRKCELTHMASVLRTGTGHYAGDVPGVSEKHVQWLYNVPLLAKGKGLPLIPRLYHPEDPFFSRLTLRNPISGYGGHDPNMRMKYGRTTAGSHLRCIAELKRNCNWHAVNYAYPYRVKPEQNEILRGQEYYRTKPIGHSKKPVELSEPKEKSKIYRVRTDRFTALQEHHRPKSLKNLVVVERSSVYSMNRIGPYREAHPLSRIHF